MRTTLARQLKRLDRNHPELFDADISGISLDKAIAIKWRRAHPRKPKQTPVKAHRRSKNRR